MVCFLFLCVSLLLFWDILVTNGLCFLHKVGMASCGGVSFLAGEIESFLSVLCSNTEETNVNVLFCCLLRVVGVATQSLVIFPPDGVCLLFLFGVSRQRRRGFCRPRRTSFSIECLNYLLAPFRIYSDILPYQHLSDALVSSS